MLRTAFDDWKRAPTPRKLAALMASNDLLVQKCANTLLLRAPCPSFMPDALQAGRIGLLHAIRTWDPSRAKFSPYAWGWVRHEMQSAFARGAKQVSYPRRLIFAKNGQDKADSFYAQHGVYPMPAQIGISAGLAVRVERARAKFVSAHFAEGLVNDTEIEADIDRQRDMKALRAFLDTLNAADKKKFWTGKDAGLTERARVFVEGRRGQRKQP
jgi:RNA polymerase sigma factor (sigma-70 family)